ncbi:MAG: hypothetical protein GDA44_14115 [Prochloron sp. SP5CPC1]|nr:hypothetical protein [Candidatus Paraprochloron terpiosi SP5CPC1]
MGKIDHGELKLEAKPFNLNAGREICLSAGMDDYISKPIKTEDLAGVFSKFKLKDK